MIRLEKEGERKTENRERERQTGERLTETDRQTETWGMERVRTNFDAYRGFVCWILIVFL